MRFIHTFVGRLRDLPIAHKLCLMTGVLLFGVAGMAFLYVFGMDTLSVTRAYVHGEGLWARAQKEAVYCLSRYGVSHDGKDYQAFLDALEVPRAYKHARDELEKPHPDLNRAYQAFVDGGSSQEDVRRAAIAFRRFRNLEYVDQALRTWQVGDELMAELESLGAELHRVISANKSGSAEFSQQTVDQLLARVDALNEQMAPLGIEFSTTLSDGSRRAKTLLVTMMLWGAAVLAVVGLLLAFAVGRNFVVRINDLVRVTRAAESGILGEEIKVTSGDEIGRLAASFNRMTRSLQDAIAERDRELTERKRAERGLREHSAALESANKALEEYGRASEAASRAKSEFLANMSHEIRTPMTAILGFADVLRADDELSRTPAHRLETIDTIIRNGEHLLHLINDILDLSKIEAGKLDVDQVACSPLQLVSDVAALMKGRAEAKGIGLVLECDGPIPESIQTDPIRLRQIFVNLIGNAIKFTETGNVTVITRLLGENEEDPKLEFDVIDTGIGLSETQISRLFEPFSQADASTTRKYGGTGLGLAISRRLAEKLGGSIQVNSTPGKGSTFTLKIATGSLQGVERIDNPTEAVPRAKPRKCPAPASDIRLACRVLVADDGADNQRIISIFLTNAGAEVEVASNGQAAVDCVLVAQEEGKPFDIILMDMQMPVLDGYDATKRLRAKGHTGPIIALTAHAMKEDRQKCLDAGCNDYMSKPVDRNKLVELVAKLAPPQSQTV